MSVESNKAATRRWLSLLNREDWEQAIRSAPANEKLVDWFIPEHRMFRAAFPDYHWAEEEMVAEGDKVVVRGKASGTHVAEFPLGELKGVLASGKRLEWEEVQIVSFEDGKIVGGWLLVDGVSRLQQLGVLPEPEQAR